MATIGLRPISVAKTVHGNSPWVQQFQEAASQTFKTGAVVVLDANGRVAEATSPNPTSILGVSADDAHNDTVAGTSLIRVWLADDETIFRANAVNTAAGSAQVTALRDVGLGCGLIKDTTAPNGDTWEITRGDVTNRRVIIIDLDPLDNVGDTNGRYHFMFFSQFRQLDYTS